MKKSDATFGAEVKVVAKAEQREQLSRIHAFNVTEKARSLRELAKHNIGKIKNIFSSAVSFFSKENNTDEKPKQINDNKVEKSSEGTILLQLDGRSSEFMQQNIKVYYENQFTTKIEQIVTQKNPNLTEAQKNIAIDKILNRLAQKPVQLFKERISTQLKEKGLDEQEIREFWQWRLAHPPQSPPLLVRKNNKDYIDYDEFADPKIVDEFLSWHVTTSTLEDGYFDDIKTTEDIEEEMEQAFQVDNDIEKDTRLLDRGRLIQLLSENSNGWITQDVYEHIESINALEAMKLLGNINSELTPTAREIADKLLPQAKNSNKNFGEFIIEYLNNKSLEDLSKTDIKAISNLIVKLDKIVTLAEEK